MAAASVAALWLTVIGEYDRATLVLAFAIFSQVTQ